MNTTDANATAVDDNLESTALAFYMLARYLHLATFDKVHDHKDYIQNLGLDMKVMV